jgi:hypothetical protein
MTQAARRWYSSARGEVPRAVPWLAAVTALVVFLSIPPPRDAFAHHAPAYGVLGKVRIVQTIQPDEVQIEMQIPLREPYTNDTRYPCLMAMAP